MAATFRASGAGGGTSSTGDRAVTFTPAVGDHITVWCSVSGNTQAAPTMSDNNGGAYSLVMRAAWNASADNMLCFVRTAAMPNTTSTTITLDTDTNTAGELVWIAYSGMTRFGASSIRSSGSQANQASGGTPTPVLNQSALTANPTIAAVASGDTTTTPNASWTERQDVSQSTPTTAIEVCTRDSGFTGTSIAFGATQSTVFASMAVELDSSLPVAAGDLTATQAADSASTDADVLVGAAATVTQAADSSSTDVDVIVGASATKTQAADSLTGAAAVATSGVSATLTATQAADSIATDVDIAIAAAATLTQDAQTSTTDADATVAGAATLTQASQTITSDVDVVVGGASSTTQAGQTITTDADVSIAATSTTTQAPDTATASGIVGSFVSCDLNASQSGDTIASVGDVAIGAAAILAQADQSSAAAASIVVGASLAATVAGDALLGNVDAGGDDTVRAQPPIDRAYRAYSAGGPGRTRLHDREDFYGRGRVRRIRFTRR
jgi:hypothetical protein